MSISHHLAASDPLTDLDSSDGRRLQTVWRRMPVERQITRLSEDNPAEEETVRVRMRRGTFRALSNASIRLESQAAVDNAARAAAQTTIAPSNLRIRRPGFRRGASIPADLSLQATLRRADRHRQNERRAGPPAAEMPRPAHPAAPRVQMPRNLDPSATTASGARIRRETRNPAGATITRDPAPAPATSSAPIAPSVSRPAPPAPMMPPAAARPLYAGPAAPTGPLAGHLAAARAELTQNMQYSDVRFDGTAMPAMQPPRPHPNAPRNYGYPAVGPPPGMYPVAPQGTAYGVQHVQPQYYRGVPAPMAPGPMYATAASRAGYGPAGANNTVTAVQPYRNGQASSAYGVAHQPPAPPGYSGPRPV